MSRVETVLGPIEPDKLGVTMTHEHSLIDMTSWFRMPTEASRKWIAKAKVEIGILGDLRRDPSTCRDNMILDDLDLMTKEISAYKDAGGSTLVICSVDGLGRDPIGLRTLSIRTGVNILVPTGFYVQNSHPDHVKNMNSEQLSDLMVKELTEGIDNTGIKAGLMGEVGCGEPVPWHPEEKKVVEAVAKTQSIVGCALTIHPALIDSKTKKPVKTAEVYVDTLEQGNANLEKFYLSHAQFTHSDPEYHMRLMDRGVTLNWDTFGFFDVKYYYYDPSFMHPTDNEMVKAIAKLCENGYDKNIMLSHDICYKHLLKTYGGYGYTHIIENIVPELRRHNVEEKQIRNMLIENPKNILSF